MRRLALLLLAVTLLLSSTAQAEWRVNAGVGVTHFLPTTPDGTHIQEAFPHDYETVDLSWRAGLEQRLSSHWAVSANALRLGTVKAETVAVADARYDPAAHQCLSHCDQTYRYHAKDLVYGAELFGTYRHRLGEVEPFGMLGLAWLHHTLTNGNLPGQYGVETFSGNQLAVRVGGGLCYDWICGDVTYYKGAVPLGNPGFPIAKDAILSLVFLSIPLPYSGGDDAAQRQAQ